MLLKVCSQSRHSWQYKNNSNVRLGKLNISLATPIIKIKMFYHTSCSLMTTVSFSYQWLEETRERKNFSHALSHYANVQSNQLGEETSRSIFGRKRSLARLQCCWIPQSWTHLKVSPSPDDLWSCCFFAAKVQIPPCSAAHGTPAFLGHWESLKCQ